MRLGWRPRAMLAAWCLLLLPTVTGVDPRGTRSLTALVGQGVVLDCPLNFPETQPVPYVIEWKKQKLGAPLYIWYDGYPPHVADEYKGRVSRVDLRNDRYGLASLNMSSITESDAGWYECIVRFLDRSPAAMGNGTWVHLDVHAPPRLVSAPPESLFVNVGDQQILACEASGTPEPTITWFKEDKPIQPSDVVAVKNDGTELRLSSISEDDIGDYICFAENSEGRVHATTRLILAGGAVIVTSPTNQTRQEASQAVFACEGRAMPANFSLRWLRDGVPVERHSGLERRFRVTDNGTLIIDPVAAEDAGLFTCEVSNGIGEPQRASAFLDVQYAAHVPYTPSVQYLPAGMEGVIACHVKANPAIQFVNWYRNGKEFEPKKVPGVTLLLNGSLLIETVRPEQQGVYRCRPFNLHGSSGESGQMQVVVREPPRFTLRPRTLYQRKVHDSIQMPCSVEGSPPPQVMWRRHDNQSLPSDRVSVNQGNITIKALRKSDFGFYECVARNSVATIVTSTQLVVEGTTPHAPHDLAANSSSYAITLQWLPGYSGGDRYTQQYAVWYRQQDQTDWSKYEVLPPGATRLTLYHLLPDTVYTLMVAASNDIGDGMFSEKVAVRTLDVGEAPTPGPGVDPAASKKETMDDDGGLPKDGTGLGYFPAVFVPKGPKPGPPLDLKMEETADGFLLSWRRPTDNPEVEVRYYSIKFRPSDGEWKRLGNDRLTDTKYLITRLQAGRSYTFKVYAHSLSNFRDSAELRYQPSARIQQKAITAALVGGLLLLIVSIILSVCAVKICNKRKRRQQEKEYNMVACRVTDVRAGLHSPVPLKKYVRRVPRLIRHASLLLWRPRPSAGLSQSLMDELDLTPRRAKMVYSVEMEYSQPLAWIARTPDGRFVVNGGDDDGGFLSGGGGSRRRRRQQQPQPLQAAAYHLHQPGSPRTPAERRLSHGFGRHQIPEQAPSVALSPDGRRFRASSPGPLAGQLGPFEFSDLSSVAVPNSVERTFPSTVLSSLSQLATPSFRERVGTAVPQETPVRRPDPRLPALRTIHEAAPPVADAGPQYENWPLTGRWRGPVAGPAHSRLPPLLPPLLRHPAALRDSGQHVHGVGHIEPPRIADIPRPRPRQRAQPVYANVWPPDQLFVTEPYRPQPYSAQSYQPDWYPAEEYTAERYRPQRPLATSSPPPLPEAPHPRTFSRAEPQTPVPRPAAPAPAPAPAAAAAGPEKPEESPSSSLGRTDRPLAYTRDRLQAAIGKVRSQLGLLRPASAPTLSRWPEESTTEPTPLDKSSSSGVGSKNTSQRTHSSSGLSQQVSDSQLPSPQQGWQERPGTQLPPYLPPPAYLPPPQPLDISVDDHYEFDPVLTPGTESPALPAAVRSRGRPVPEMEARVQAMRQEFLQYRQRRARRHRSGENVVTETVC